MIRVIEKESRPNADKTIATLRGMQKQAAKLSTELDVLLVQLEKRTSKEDSELTNIIHTK